MGLGWIGFSHNGYSEAVGSEELGFAALEPAVDFAALHICITSVSKVKLPPVERAAGIQET